ncbi:MAG TPA: class I SAM-dependent methyltransferase [Candidatus Rifleibacterium sp.]|nr:class I SAM-dependent methyltransferase [Candidatus Rifleibacterium sp.]HPT46054.1 class I SAM-dependent methyltransferase [Candidatus Rifleibacterium sp.]
MMKTFDKQWNEVHATRNWGKYPAEELVRFMSRLYAPGVRRQIKVLDLGCGTGANTWFLCREGFLTVAFDGAFAALPKARELCRNETRPPLLLQADAGVLPFADESFDAVVEIGALAANTSAGIRSILSEIRRVLKPGGSFFSSVLFTPATTGYGSGEKLDAHSYRNISDGPVAGLGTIHFFSRAEIRSLWQKNGFGELTIDRLERSDRNGAFRVSFYMVGATRLKK